VSEMPAGKLMDMPLLLVWPDGNAAAITEARVRNFAGMYLERPTKDSQSLKARLSPFKASTELSEDELERLSAAIHDDLERALELREAGKGDSVVYAIHDRLGEPCPQCGTPIARVDFEEHTIYYCPSCQTGGRQLKDRRLSRLLR